MNVQPHVYAIEGTARAIVEFGLLRDLKGGRLHCLPSGRLGGLVDLGAAVVGKPVVALEGTFGDNAHKAAAALGLRASVDCVIYLVDPYDVTSDLAETSALKRECVVAGKPFLATHAAATGWFNLLAATCGCTHFLDHQLAAAINLTGFPHRAIAMVAHDEKKRDIIEFALDNYAFLDAFAHRFGTGTTASLLNGTVPERLRADIQDSGAYLSLFAALGIDPPERLATRHDEMCRLRDLARELGKRHDVDPWVQELKSGPQGGDLQAGEAILMNFCDAVLFFEDPLSPHEHDADIAVFERAARVSNRPERVGHKTHGVMCLHDRKSASAWTALRRAVSGAVPITLEAAFLETYGVALVLPPSKRDDNGNSWAEVTEEAALYLINSIAAGGKARSEERQRLRVAIAPGGAINEILNRIPDAARIVRQRAAAMERALDRQRRKALATLNGCEPSLEALVSDIVRRRRLLERFAEKPIPFCWRCEEVAVAPMTGAFGSSHPHVEANAHAQILAELVGGDYMQLAQSPFVSTGARHIPDSSIAAITEHWDNCDIVIMTCGELDPRYPSFFRGRASAPMPERLCDDMLAAGAVGYIASLFVGDREDNRTPLSTRYDRLGMTAEQIQKVASTANQPKSSRDAILVAAIDEDRDRLPTIVAVLNAGLVSTLITDRATATGILRLTQ